MKKLQEQYTNLRKTCDDVKSRNDEAADTVRSHATGFAMALGIVENYFKGSL